jgi:CPA1 family monovalent cation:H+ antiporter
VSGIGFSIPAAAGEFAAIVIGEIAWGAALGWAFLRLRHWAADTRVEMVMALLTPFAAFWIPEVLGGSGVLATVTCGLFVSWNGPRFISPATRLQGFFVWDMVVYLIEGVIFLLTGLQAHQIIAVHDGDNWGRLGIEAGAVCLLVVLVRFVWVFAAVYARYYLRKGKGEQPPSWRGVFLVGFTGIRGVVSLAAALSIPLTVASGAAFPNRDLLLLVTFAVILVTLVGQGLTFGPLIRLLRLDHDGRREAEEAKRQEVAARVRSIDAALARLDALEGASAQPETVAALRRRHEDRRAYFVAACQDISEGRQALSATALQLRFVDAERQSIAELYCRGEIDDDARRRIERELDLEDSRLHHAAQSGVARTL